MRASLPEMPHASRADHEACRAAIRTGSRTFYAASMLLPPSVRTPAYGLYAFCRLSDDAVDEVDSDRMRAVDRLSDRLRRIYDGRPANHPADRSLADLVARHEIPEDLPRALLEGLAWDAEGRRYASVSELAAYAARVAGTVGAMMTIIMGVRDRDALARACDLGVAMQFTNIARDVGDDARAGRLYLPLDWLAEAGIEPEAFLRDPRPSQALATVVARLLASADLLYARAEAGIGTLPSSCRPAIRAAGRIYAEIGRAIERNGLDPVTDRARVPAARKVALLAQAVLPQSATARLEAPPLPEVTFLVDAAARHGHPAFRRGLPRWWNISARIVRVLDLIEQLREREAFQRSAPS